MNRNMFTVLTSQLNITVSITFTPISYFTAYHYRQLTCKLGGEEANQLGLNRVPDCRGISNMQLMTAGNIILFHVPYQYVKAPRSDK